MTEDLKWNELDGLQQLTAIGTFKEKFEKEHNVIYTEQGVINKLKDKTFNIIYNQYDDEFDVEWH